MSTLLNRFVISPRPLISAVLSVTLISMNAQAAVLSNVEGAVFVNHGEGFVPASTDASLNPGDRVRTKKGSASIVYDNGCELKVPAHKMAVVSSEAPFCAETASQTQALNTPNQTGWQTDSLNSPNSAETGLKDSAAYVPDHEAGVDPLLVGGVLAGGAVGLAVALASSDNGSSGKSVSP